MTAFLLIIGALWAEYDVIMVNAVQFCSSKPQWAVLVLISSRPTFRGHGLSSVIFLHCFNLSMPSLVPVLISTLMSFPDPISCKDLRDRATRKLTISFAIVHTAPLLLRPSPSGPYFLSGFVTLFVVVLFSFIP